MNITIDIETIASPILTDLDKIEAPANYKDAEKIQAYKLEKQQEERLKTPLKSLKGYVFCIGINFNNNQFVLEPFTKDLEIYTNLVDAYESMEKSVIRQFDIFLEKYVIGNDYNIIGHYIKSFDLPFLYHRAIKYKCRNVYKFCSVNRYSKNVFDTHEMISLTDYKNHYSLSDILDFLGIDNHKKETNGALVQSLFDKGEYQKIYDYCKQDVIAEYEVYKRVSMLEESEYPF